MRDTRIDNSENQDLANGKPTKPSGKNRYKPLIYIGIVVVVIVIIALIF